MFEMLDLNSHISFQRSRPLLKTQVMLLFVKHLSKMVNLKRTLTLRRCTPPGRYALRAASRYGLRGKQPCMDNSEAEVNQL